MGLSRPGTVAGENHLKALVDELRRLELRLRLGGGQAKIDKQHQRRKTDRAGALGASAGSRLPILRGRAADCVGQLRWPGALGGRGHGRGQDRGAPRGGGGQRRHGESRRVVARDHRQNSARAGDRDAQPHPDRLPRRLSRREPAASGRDLPRPVRRGPHLLLQLPHAAEAARAADRRRHGPLHRRRRLSARVERRHRHGERHQLHGAGRSQPGARGHR